MTKELSEKISMSDKGVVRLKAEGRNIFFKLSDIVLIRSEKSRYESYPRNVNIDFTNNVKLSLNLSEEVYNYLITNYQEFL